MQFAGQRTDANLKPIGKPDNLLIKLGRDILPSPEAVLVTGITPQQTLTDGITEAEFCKYFVDKLATKDTCFVGFNNLRFDNEFIRFILWRNFYDAYEWFWKDGRSTWDLLDVVRMTRALRPDGIIWPFASDGKPANKLELLAAVNKLDHSNAHDALSDVQALIALARLLKSKQPKLYGYLLNIKDKTKVASLVNSGQPIVYTSGRYSAEFEKTTVAVGVAKISDRNSTLMYDLRVDPDQYKDLSPAKLAELWQLRGKEAEYFPVKVLAYNHCPAIAPLSVLDKKSESRLMLHKQIIENHFNKLQKIQDFGDKLLEAHKLTQKAYQQEMIVDETNVDGALYNNFLKDDDKTKMRVVRSANAEGLAGLDLDFSDDRLRLLLPLYKARNFPNSLNPDVQTIWTSYHDKKILGTIEEYFSKINELSASVDSDTKEGYLLEELRLWGESILPEI